MVSEAVKQIQGGNVSGVDEIHPEFWVLDIVGLS